MNWLKNLFRKKDYRDTSRMYDFLSHYAQCEAEIGSMKNFMREQNMKSQYFSCELLRTTASKDVRFRYGLKTNHVGFAWYLLEEFYKGNITIKKDVQPIAGREIHT